MNNEAPQAMSQRVGHYHTLNVLLFNAERRKTSEFACARAHGGASAASALVLPEGACFGSLPPPHKYIQVFCIQRGLWIIPIEIIDCLSTGVAE